MKKLSYYIHCFKNLRRDYRNGGAPHKPILLISIIQAIQNSIIDSHKIFITPDLVGLFKSNWRDLVESKHTCLFSLPFYHMRSEPFWRLVPNKGCEKWVNSKTSMRSINNLTTAVNHATIDLELFNLINIKVSSNILLNCLLETYFPRTKNNYNSGNNNFINEIEKQIVEEPSEYYSEMMKKISKNLDENSFQEEIYVRSNVFKTEVPKAYNFTCCISRLRVNATLNISMIDACHIIPFADSFNDTITNGISLCPNLHRAFDRGLISIDDNYRVLVNNNFVEENQTTYSIRQFKGVNIILPQNKKHYPSLLSIRSNRERFNFSV